MSRKLDILVPRYKEPFEVLKPLLDSLEIQQNVDFEKDFGVIIVDDGEMDRLDESRFEIYDFPIEYYTDKPHGGVSNTRNACLDHSTAKYVMWCDIDDCFFNACGLWIIFREMDNGGFDSLISAFIEETRHPETKEVMYINHDMDQTFVHGKVHRRKYLKKKQIRWNDKLLVHEDSFLHGLTSSLSKDVKYCQTPFYLWKWRDESVCRHDPLYLNKTYNNMLESNDALVDEFVKRGMSDKAMFYASMMIFDAYYTMNKPEWINQDRKEYRDKTELRFKEYYLKHKKKFDDMPMQDKMQLSNSIRTRSVGEGMLMEAVTIDEWLEHITKL